MSWFEYFIFFWIHQIWWQLLCWLFFFFIDTSSRFYLCSFAVKLIYSFAVAIFLRPYAAKQIPLLFLVLITTSCFGKQLAAGKNPLLANRLSELWCARATTDWNSRFQLKCKRLRDMDESLLDDCTILTTIHSQATHFMTPVPGAADSRNKWVEPLCATWCGQQYEEDERRGQKGRKTMEFCQIRMVYNSQIGTSMRRYYIISIHFLSQSFAFLFLRFLFLSSFRSTVQSCLISLSLSLSHTFVLFPLQFVHFLALSSFHHAWLCQF